MKVAIVGGGIVGLFASYYLREEDVTIFEKEELGHGSVHAAGLIEPFRFDRINSLNMMKKMLRFRNKGVTVMREVDRRWLITLLKEMEKTPPEEAWETMREMASFSLKEYKRMAEEKNDFLYFEDGLLEVYSDKTGMEKGVEEERRSPFRNKFEEVEVDGFAGGIFFPELSRLSTEKFVERMKKEIAHVKVIKREVKDLNELNDFDVIVLTSGAHVRDFVDVPLTAFRGVGFRVEGKPVLNSAFVHVESGIAVSPLDYVKVTGGFDADFSDHDRRDEIIRSASNLVKFEKVVDVKWGLRPCSPDGFPILGRRDNLVVATGACRLGWSYAPAMGMFASKLARGEERDYGYLSRFLPPNH
ncbi:FAD-dependent oxidoreductase [Sulfuracidifex tepidarius]|uniref:D-proline dehydrogenase n=1 Tax=Sulfuracidifex tepidarius TaxID=1294262 RepID=A0A510E348_9CREN|nr:FAD-dependent oxidoreductase [Sulfuracidifex tepidarius]BBG24140.1 D-proline dehydrogenase [Sulfuracidifex tepidarius]BBG26897.1 D-proline dehydrogenase [Sulfuracidifex tepidarius]